MKLAEIVKELKLKTRAGDDKLDREVKGGYTGDLLSDVMANSHEGDIWITRQVHQNIVAVASLKDHAGIVLVQGSEPARDTVEKAKAEGIPLFITDESAFEIAAKVHSLVTKKRS